MKKQKTNVEEKGRDSCADIDCPFHGKLRVRGRVFQGKVIKKFPRRICISFNRVIAIKKYERQMEKRTKIHARLPDCLKKSVDIGDYVEVQSCRPLSKIIHFVVIKKIRGKE